MAIGKKMIFVGISIIFGLACLSTLHGLAADRIFDRHSDVRISSRIDSDFNLRKLENFNETRLRRDILRRKAYRRDVYSATSFLRKNLDLNLRSHFREEKSRIGEILSRSRELERTRRDLDSNFEQIRSRFITERVISSDTERQGRSDDIVRFRLERLSFNPVKRLDRIERDEFRNLRTRDSSSESRLFDSLTRRFQRSENPTNDRESTFRQNTGDTQNERILLGRRERTDIAPRRVIRSRSYQLFFQTIWDWGATAYLKVDGISDYLFTVIAALFVLDTVGQMVPVKKTEGKGFGNFLRNIVLMTGNTMVH